MGCPICDIVEKKNSVPLIYEDYDVVAFLSTSPACIGHTIIAAKEHFTILEQVPDTQLSKIFNVANRISIACFESLHVQGTNLLIANGTTAGQNTPHVMLHLLPRRENDGLDFLWQTKKVSEEEMSTIELMLKEEPIDNNIQKKSEEQKAIADKPVRILGKELNEGENYLIKHLRRIP